MHMYICTDVSMHMYICTDVYALLACLSGYALPASTPCAWAQPAAASGDQEQHSGLHAEDGRCVMSHSCVATLVRQEQCQVLPTYEHTHTRARTHMHHRLHHSHDAGSLV